MPSVVTPSGMTMDLRAVHSRNAQLLMVVSALLPSVRVESVTLSRFFAP